MKSLLRIVLLSLAFALGTVLASALADDATPRASWPASQHAGPHITIIEDLLDGHLHQHSLLDAALLASGAYDRASLARHRFRIDRCVALVQESLAANNVAGPRPVINISEASRFQGSSERQLAVAVLRVIHDEILVGQFVDHCDNVADTLDSGDFNCVTATTVFQIVATKMGLQSMVELLPQHVRCRVRVGPSHPAISGDLNRSYTIETTRAEGVASYSSLPEGRVISAARLVGKLYYNRALDLLHDRQFERSLRHADLAWRLDPAHNAARENISIVRSHWAIAKAQRGEWRPALSLLHSQQAGSRQYSDAELTHLALAQVFVFRAWLESDPQLAADIEDLHEQLLVCVAEHPRNLQLLQLLQSLPKANGKS